MISLINFAAAHIGTTCNPQTDNLADAKNTFFSFPHWWQYIKTGEYDAVGVCSPKVTMPDGIWPIGLALLNMLLVLAGIVAVISIIYAGITLVTSSGNTEKGVAARKRVINAFIGLGLVLIASGSIAFIGNRLGG